MNDYGFAGKPSTEVTYASNGEAIRTDSPFLVIDSWENLSNHARCEICSWPTVMMWVGKVHDCMMSLIACSGCCDALSSDKAPSPSRWWRFRKWLMR